MRVAWPKDVRLPTLWTREPDPGDAISALHAKVIVFDDADHLVSSANLTFHGLRGNLELGVLVRGAVAVEMRALLQRWISDGLLSEVRRPPRAAR